MSCTMEARLSTSSATVPARSVQDIPLVSPYLTSKDWEVLLASSSQAIYPCTCVRISLDYSEAQRGRGRERERERERERDDHICRYFCTHVYMRVWICICVCMHACMDARILMSALCAFSCSETMYPCFHSGSRQAVHSSCSDEGGWHPFAQ